MHITTNIYQAKLKGFNLTFTGHSLGGGLASAASLVTGNKAVVFNPAGVNSNTLKPYGVNFAAADSLITRYVVNGEILETLQSSNSPLGIAMPNALGKKITIYPNSILMDPFNGHRMSTVLNSR